ncbi:hypothetical protein, partial [Streptomyces javensis]|uniref:hypothetical protein n=1 Tax=Streptomyces javensis TaxID=114698 RepID=UPI0031DB1A6E
MALPPVNAAPGRGAPGSAARRAPRSPTSGAHERRRRAGPPAGRGACGGPPTLHQSLLDHPARAAHDLS